MRLGLGARAICGKDDARLCASPVHHVHGGKGEVAEMRHGAVGPACRLKGWRACLRIFGDGSLLLSSASGEVQVWQSGEVRGGQVRFSAHGWSDFCPLREASLCQMP